MFTRILKVIGLVAALAVLALASANSGSIVLADTNEEILQPISPNPTLSRIPSVPAPATSFAFDGVSTSDVDQSDRNRIAMLFWNALKTVRYALHTLNDLNALPLVDASGGSELVRTAITNRTRWVGILEKTWNTVCPGAPNISCQITFRVVAEGHTERGENVCKRSAESVDSAFTESGAVYIGLCPAFFTQVRFGQYKDLVHELIHIGGGTEAEAQQEYMIIELKDLALALWVPNDFSLPSQAVGKARSDSVDRIIIAPASTPGIYNEALNINKSVELMGTGDNRVVLDGSGLGNVGGITIGGNVTVSVESLTVRSFNFSGIYVEDSAQVTIDNIISSGNGGNGLYIHDSAQATAQNSQIFNNGWLPQGPYSGIVVWDSSQARILKNTIHDNQR